MNIDGMREKIITVLSRQPRNELYANTADQILEAVFKPMTEKSLILDPYIIEEFKTFLQSSMRNR